MPDVKDRSSWLGSGIYVIQETDSELGLPFRQLASIRDDWIVTLGTGAEQEFKTDSERANDMELVRRVYLKQDKQTFPDEHVLGSGQQ